MSDDTTDLAPPARLELVGTARKPPRSRGRSRKPAEERRVVAIRVSFTEADFASLEAAARREHVEPRDWIRAVVLRRADRVLGR